MKHLNSRFFITLLFTLVFIGGCASKKFNKAEQRIEVLEMSQEVLQTLYEKQPDVKQKVREAAGYAVFQNANVNFIVASVGSGYGVVIDNKTSKKTYMKMAEAGVGFGAGVKDFSLIFVFHDTEAMSRFVDQGWSAGAQADASAKAGDQGAAVGGEVAIDNVTIYQITQSGIALQLTVKGTRIWRDPDLN